MDHSIMDMFDWSTNIPKSKTFITEEDFHKSCTYKIITNRFRDPLLSGSESDSDSEIPKKPPAVKIISYSVPQVDKPDKVTECEDFKYIPGLFPLPYFSSLSKLDKKTHLACLKVLATKDTAMTPVPLRPPTKYDLDIYEKNKETIEEEQKEFVECAKKLWLSNHSVRVIKHPPIVEDIEKKYLEAQSAKIRQLPQNYEFYEVVNISSITKVDLIHRKNIFEVTDVPCVRLPTSRRVMLTLNHKPGGKRTDPTLSSVKDLQPSEDVTPDVNAGNRAELLGHLSALCASQDVDIVAAASALCCLQDNFSFWLVPVTVLQTTDKDGRLTKRIMLEGEIQIPAPAGTTKMERAYTQLFKELLTCKNEPERTVANYSELEIDETFAMVPEHKDTNVKSQKEQKEQKETDIDQQIIEPSITSDTCNELDETQPNATKPEETQSYVTEPKETHPSVTEPKEIQPIVTEPKKKQPYVTNNSDSDSDVDVLIIVEEDKSENPTESEVPSPSARASTPKAATIRRPSLYEEDMTVNQQSCRTYVGPMTRCRTAVKNSTSPKKSIDKTPCIESSINRTPTKIKEELSNDNTIMKCSPMQHKCNRKYSTSSIELREAHNSDNDGGDDSNNVTFDATSVVRSGEILINSALTPAPLKYSPPHPKSSSPESRGIKRNADLMSGKQKDRQTGPWRFACEKPVYPFKSIENLADDLPENYTTAHPDISPQRVLSNEVTNKQAEPTRDKIESVKIKAEQIKNAAKPVEVSCCKIDNTFKPIGDLANRRFDRWELCTPDGKDNISLIVHCSQQLRTDAGDAVLAVPIVEYQADLGATRLRRVQARALALYLRGPQARMLTGRLNSTNSELLSLDWISQDRLLNVEMAVGSRASLSSAFSLLHRTLSALKRLQPGNYMLRHDAKQTFSHVYIYKECPSFDPQASQGFAGQRINLHDLSLYAVAIDETPAPCLCTAILPWHRQRQILPLVFVPYDYKHPKKHIERRMNEQKKKLNTPTFIIKKKKKNTKKNKNKNKKEIP